jgi:hypothetical protein
LLSDHDLIEKDLVLILLHHVYKGKFIHIHYLFVVETEVVDTSCLECLEGLDHESLSFVEALMVGLVESEQIVDPEGGGKGRLDVLQESVGLFEFVAPEEAEEEEAVEMIVTLVDLVCLPQQHQCFLMTTAAVEE